MVGDFESLRNGENWFYSIIIIDQSIEQADKSLEIKSNIGGDERTLLVKARKLAMDIRTTREAAFHEFGYDGL